MERHRNGRASNPQSEGIDLPPYVFKCRYIYITTHKETDDGQPGLDTGKTTEREGQADC